MKYLKFIFRVFIILFGLSIVIGLAFYIYAKASPKILIKSANNITFYDKNNNVFFKCNEKKEWVSLDEISPFLIQSTIYTEDKYFYKHFGFDFLRIGKAFLANIKSKKMVQGASTITQQYAKNLFLDFDKTFKRKWEEALYTLRTEANYSKNEILEGYLNTINYGHGKYGIENASKYYFGKKAKDLSLAEASLLAAIPKAPSKYSPLIDYQAAKNRQLLILENLKNNNIITEKEENEAYNLSINLIGKEDISDDLSSIHYYQDAVLEELNTLDKIPKNYSNMNGLKIYTTLDYSMQKILEENVREAFQNKTDLQTASVVMDPKTGGVYALIGGRDYNQSTYNRAISSRQVGSTMKPFLYYAALENGFTASSAFLSEPTTFPTQDKKTYTPSNYNNKYGNKPISMATAIAYSENIYAIKTHMFLGYDALIQVAKRVGIPEKLESIASLPLGTNEINILNMSAGYAAFANLGYKVAPYFITKVTDGNNNILYKKEYNSELVLNSSLVYILNNLLTATYDPLYIDYNYPTAISLSSKLKHKYALKSGTTNSDNWNIGFNKNILCSVWVGYDNSDSLTTKDYKYAQNIWYNTVEKIEENGDSNDGWYEKPKNVVGLLVEPISGKPLSDSSKNTKLVYFLKGTEPHIADPTFDEIFDSEES